MADLEFVKETNLKPAMSGNEALADKTDASMWILNRGRLGGVRRRMGPQALGAMVPDLHLQQVLST